MISLQIFPVVGDSTLQIVFLDTIILAGITRSDHLCGLPPAGPANPSQAEEEWKWIEQTLSSSTADWLIVCGHYPGDANNQQPPCTVKQQKKQQHNNKNNTQQQQN